MKQKQNIKTAVFVLFSLIGLVAAGFLVKRTLELRKGAAFGTITMGLHPDPVEICVGQTRSVSIILNPVVNSGIYNISAAELRFSFNPAVVAVAGLNFHEYYGQGIWNQAANANQTGEIRFTALSNLSGTFPQQAFSLAQISLTGVEEGSFNLTFNADNYQVTGIRENADDLDRDLLIASAGQISVPVIVSDCGDSGVDHRCPVEGEYRCLENLVQQCQAVAGVRDWVTQDDCQASNATCQMQGTTAICVNSEGEEEPGETATVNFRVKLVGTNYEINDQPIVVDVPDLPMKVVVKGDNYYRVIDEVMVSFDENAIGTGSFQLDRINPSTTYAILIKGPVHVATKFCKDHQTDHCWLGEENISLSAGVNNFDWTSLSLEPGDLNGDGVANSLDYAIIRESYGQTGTGLVGDVNFNGQVNTQDTAFFLDTLSTRYEDEI